MPVSCGPVRATVSLSGRLGVASLAPEDDMRRLLRTHELHALVSQRGQVHSLEKPLPASEHDRHDGDVQLVDQK
jgi:hypothetical protein